MYKIISQGGFMMIPILLGSVFSIAIIIERFWFLQRTKVLPSDFLKRMDRMIKDRKIAEATSACRENDSTVARIFIAGLENSDRPRPEIREALQVAGKQETSVLLRWIGSLGVIAAVEPLMGLLGTVLGMIEAFMKIEEMKVVGDPSVVASGVWKALITTAAGLIIAIPTYAFYRYFKGRVLGIIMDMESYAFRLLQHISLSKSPSDNPGDS
jgi:biopolymer transport protein ExbB